jgi:uncharacterized membrane protein YbhN (UPF0104 family)
MADRRYVIGETAFNRLKQAAIVAVFAAAVFIVVREARSIDWSDVLGALRNYAPASLVLALAICIPGQLACACFDLIGRHATGRKLPVTRVMLISFTGYYFSLNLGALVGGLAFRYRLYVPYRLPSMMIGQIITLSVLTNWLGYVLIAGLVLAHRPPDLPAGWGPDSVVLRGIGFLLLAMIAGYVIACAIKGGTRVRWKGSELQLPTLGVAAVQFALSIISWSAIGAVITWLLPGDIDWFAVVPILMISAIAGAWSHIPGGLGVTEVVFLTLLGHRIDAGELLAALLAFRAIYYFLPFLLAVATYVYLETTAGKVCVRNVQADV